MEIIGKHLEISNLTEIRKKRFFRNLLDENPAHTMKLISIGLKIFALYLDYITCFIIQYYHQILVFQYWKYVLYSTLI